MLRGLSWLLVSLLATVPGAQLARADNFSFSFTNAFSGPGYVSGTVTGEIIGLTNNSTGPAAQVIITSFPAGLNSVLGSGPINAMLWAHVYQNSFTETNGMVTGGGFWAQDTIGSNTSGAQLYINGDNVSPGPFDFLNLDGADELYVYGALGAGAFAAANIVPLNPSVPPSVPALSEWATLLLATLLASSGLLLMNKYRKAA
jgi:hypothetical protein